MNPSLLGVFAAVALATGLWLAGRRPRPLLKSTDTRDVAALNRAQNTLVWEARQTPPVAAEAESGPGAGADSADWAPRTPLVALPAPRLSERERLAWLRELQRHHQAGGRQRLEAMRRARILGQRQVLPLLRRGLRDADPAVIREAALAMEAFRGRPGPVAPPAQLARPDQAIRVDQPTRPLQTAAPRNVARTR